MNEFILMGDIKDSRSYDEQLLQAVFQNLVETANHHFSDEIKSPLTITLGDEFQGIAVSLKSIIDIIFHIEEEILLLKTPIEIRYVCVYGEIRTPINPDIAHGMMGPGLTLARELLTKKRRSRPKYFTEINDKDVIRNQVFSALADIQSHWRKDDFRLIYEMIHNSSDAELGDKFGKHRTQIWKFRNKYLISAYQNLKDVIRTLN